MAESWEAVAHALARRLYHHAHYRCSHGDEATPDCPFCEDKAAYNRYVAKIEDVSAKLKAKYGAAPVSPAPAGR